MENAEPVSLNVRAAEAACRQIIESLRSLHAQTLESKRRPVFVRMDNAESASLNFRIPEATSLWDLYIFGALEGLPAFGARTLSNIFTAFHRWMNHAWFRI
jgi:hypothetical protein